MTAIDQTKCIVFQADDGGTVGQIVFPPADSCFLSMEQIAAKDVPAGRPYKIIPIADLPPDDASFNAWIVDAADLDDGVGANFGAGTNLAVVGWHVSGNPYVVEVDPE